jgi:Lrp/AsnC ligand binding domain
LPGWAFSSFWSAWAAGGHDPVAGRLAAIPEVLEVHTITGAGDMLCRVAARDHADLQRVLDAIVATDGVVRSATVISLATQVPYRILTPGPGRLPPFAGPSGSSAPSLTPLPPLTSEGGGNCGV